MKTKILEMHGKNAANYFDKYYLCELSNNIFIPFCGNNCDDCMGWDGESKRCECGNRRVSWEWDGKHLTAEAY